MLDRILCFFYFARHFLRAERVAKSRNAVFGKICGNYHFLLGFSAFVWVWLYNGEFWHKVNDYAKSTQIHIQAQNATTTNKHLPQTIQNQLKAVPPPLKIL
ncbi:hypothetical protein [Helicobacter sp. T3_23-1059]